MNNPIEIQLVVTIPQNMMGLCCSRRISVNSAMKGEYNLKETDPERLKEIIKMVQAAPDSALYIIPRRPNNKMQHAIDDYNDTLSEGDKPLTAQDVVRMISWDTYEITSQSINEDHPEDEVHIFEKMVVPGITKNRKTQVYVKFVDPVEGETITVIAAHRRCDL